MVVAHTAYVTAAVHLQQYPVTLFVFGCQSFQRDAIYFLRFHLPAQRRFEGGGWLCFHLAEKFVHRVSHIFFFCLSLQYDTVGRNRQRLRFCPEGRGIHK